MHATYNDALMVAREKYPHRINHFEEYRDYFVFEHVDGTEHFGGTMTPIVIRKSDLAALNYNPTVFMGLDPDAEDIGPIIAEGVVNN